MYVGSRDRLSELEGYWVIYESDTITHQEMSSASQYLLATTLQGSMAKSLSISRANDDHFTYFYPGISVY